MIDVYIAFAMRSNPGPSAVCALGIVAGSPSAHTRVYLDPITNFHAAWLAIDLSTERAALRSDPRITLYTNLSHFNAIEERDLPAAGAHPSAPFWDLAIAAHRRIQVTGSTVRWVRSSEAPPWLEQARSAAAVALAGALDARRTPEVPR